MLAEFRGSDRIDVPGASIKGQLVMLCCQEEAIGFLLGGGVHSWSTDCHPQ